jgi:anti-sigma regulatory factor (Ser/Thr protein kinase)/serine/threonine protein phosphatase PrpC
MSDTKSTTFNVRDTLDCAAAQHSVRQSAMALGFGHIETEEVVLAVAELTSNIVKHAGHGVLSFKPERMREQMGIEISALDYGPGMGDVDRCLQDGYSTAGGLGYGLGTINRLMDEVEINSCAGTGTHIVCRRWLRNECHAAPAPPSPWDVGVVTRARRSAPENGDAFVIRRWQEKLLVGVIDGLGHGQLAQQAALAAQQYVLNHYDLPLSKIFSGAGRACRGTRGAVMALTRFEAPGRMSFASLGNVEARAWHKSQRMPLHVQRGILGLDDRTITVQENHWPPGSVLVLHSDGLTNHWQWEDFSGLEHDPASLIASRLLHKLATKDDDATALVVTDRFR